jgi:hypothetical protein
MAFSRILWLGRIPRGEAPVLGLSSGGRIPKPRNGQSWLGFLSPKSRGVSFKAGYRFWSNHVFVQLEYKSDERLVNVRDRERIEGFISLEVSQWLIDERRDPNPSSIHYESEERSFYSRFILGFGLRKYLSK